MGCCIRPASSSRVEIYMVCRYPVYLTELFEESRYIFRLIESDKTTSIYNVSTRVLSKK